MPLRLFCSLSFFLWTGISTHFHACLRRVAKQDENVFDFKKLPAAMSSFILCVAGLYTYTHFRSGEILTSLFFFSAKNDNGVSQRVALLRFFDIF